MHIEIFERADGRLALYDFTDSDELSYSCLDDDGWTASQDAFALLDGTDPAAEGWIDERLVYEDEAASQLIFSTYGSHGSDINLEPCFWHDRLSASGEELHAYLCGEEVSAC